jgi:hypothetical protein
MGMDNASWSGKTAGNYSKLVLLKAIMYAQNEVTCFGFALILLFKVLNI